MSAALARVFSERKIERARHKRRIERQRMTIPQATPEQLSITAFGDDLYLQVERKVKEMINNETKQQ